jgi:hypothetical protein
MARRLARLHRWIEEYKLACVYHASSIHQAEQKQQTVVQGSVLIVSGALVVKLDYFC